MWRNKKVQVEKEKKKPFFFPPSLVHSALPLRSPISSSPRGALLPRNRMRSAVALGRAAVAMPSCSRRASSAPAPARRVVAVKVNFELELLSRPLFRDAGEKRQRSCLSLRLRRRRHAGPLHKPSPPAHDHIEVSTLGGQPRQRSDRGSPRGGLCSLGSLPSTPPSRSTDAHDHEKKTLSHLLPNFTQAGGMEQVGSAYAAALIETAQAKGSLDAVHADVDTLQVRKN